MVISFSALQRAENSSMTKCALRCENYQKFQCSSASRKFLNKIVFRISKLRISSFSALQRAENSSISSVRPILNRIIRFSALQRAENSSIVWWDHASANIYKFQCSSASRKFLNTSLTSQHARPAGVSVLFSEPKIPQ